jgi:HSP20 family protein
MARTFDPIREMESLFTQMNRLPASSAMPMDLYREGETFIARIDLPGVDPQSIDVDIDERTLTVRAQRNPVDLSDQAKWLTRERPSGTFARQLTLGHDIALDGIAAEYSDGVLTLRIPVAEGAKPRKVAVQHLGTAQSIEAPAETVEEG